MRRPMSRSVWNPLTCLVLLAASLGLLAPASLARAGIGDLVKKAKSKAAQAVGQKPSQPTETAEGPGVVFDDITLELTEARVAGILGAFEAAGKAGEGRPALAQKLVQAQEDRGALDEKEGEAVRELQRKRADVEGCYHDGYKTAEERRGEEYKNRAFTDPVLREKFMKAAQQNSEAAARGDSAALERLNQVMREELAPTREDSAQVRKTCGPVPPHSAAEDELNAYDKQIAGLQEEIRAIDSKVAETQAKTSGLKGQQWATALERIHGYLSWRRSHTPAKSSGKSSASSGSSSGSSAGNASTQSSTAATSPRGFTEVEVEALEKYLEKLRAALG